MEASRQPTRRADTPWILFLSRLVIRRATLYLGLTLLLAALYGLAALVAYSLLGRLMPLAHGPSVPGFLAALSVAVAFRPLHDRLRKGVDRIFLGERADALRVLAAFGGDRASDEASLSRDLMRLVEEALAPRWAVLHLEVGTRRVLGDPPAEPEATALVVPLAERGSLTLGPRRNGMPYDAEERQLLRALAAQAAIAFRNARLFEERLWLRASEGVASRLAGDRQQMISQVIHDLRSDLFNISLSAHLAKRTPEDPSAYRSIRESLAHIERLLDEKSRWIRDGRRETSTPLRPAVEAALAALAPQLAQKRQLLDLELPEVDPILPLSAVELKQVVVNLLGNAHKFAPPGSIIRLMARCEAGTLRLEVHDEGPGIPAGLLAELGSGKRGDTGVPGSGLGLRNVQAIVQPVRGILSWRNAERGAIVEVRLPLTS